MFSVFSTMKTSTFSSLTHSITFFFPTEVNIDKMPEKVFSSAHQSKYHVSCETLTAYFQLASTISVSNHLSYTQITSNYPPPSGSRPI